MEHVDIDFSGNLSNVEIMGCGDFVRSSEGIGRNLRHDIGLSVSVVVGHEMGIHCEFSDQICATADGWRAQR